MKLTPRQIELILIGVAFFLLGLLAVAVLAEWMQ